VCFLAFWFAFYRGIRVPLLSMADLGFHELGHLLCYMLPVNDTITAAAGSAVQIGVPLGLALYFFFFPRGQDLLAGAIMLAWASTNMQDASVYIADAPTQALPLLGGENSVHDWAFLLGPEQFNMLNRAGNLADALRRFGIVTLSIASTICLSLPYLEKNTAEKIQESRKKRETEKLRFGN